MVKCRSIKHVDKLNVSIMKRSRHIYIIQTVFIPTFTMLITVTAVIKANWIVSGLFRSLFPCPIDK